MKTFNCPFCKEKMRRELLVKHIEKKHDEEIPEGFTAYRLVYDIVNNHPDHKGTCTVCGKPTKWNEKRQKYERLCRDPKCYAAVKKTYQKRILKVYNKTSLMDDPNHLEKMLAGRKISGKYKWSDGKVFTYTGSYEKNFMEFLDKVLEFKSNEILAPGPVLKYDYNGSEHMWITDFLILPYNLIVEIKDGGEGNEKNPNKRYMPDTRKRTAAKEKMITNLGKYSYIRLTNNEFNQFLSILAELKMNVNDQDEKPLYRIHEDACLNENINLVFSDDDFTKNLDEWKQGSIKLLFITGLSGSGKSSLAKILQSKYKADYIGLDELYKDIATKDMNSEIVDWYNKSHNVSISTLQWPKSEQKFYYELTKIAIEYINYKINKSKRLIIEGIQIPRIQKAAPYLFKNSAVIIKSTSYAKSAAFRGLTRDIPEDFKNFVTAIKGDIGTVLSFNKILKDKINDFEDSITKKDTELQEGFFSDLKDKYIGKKYEDHSKEEREKMYKLAFSLMEKEYKAIKNPRIKKGIRLLTKRYDEISYEEYLDDYLNHNGSKDEYCNTMTLAYWDLWDYNQRARTDENDENDIFYKYLEDMCSRITKEVQKVSKEFDVTYDGDWDDGAISIRELKGTGRYYHEATLSEATDLFEDIDNDSDNEFKQQADEMDKLEKNARKVMDQLADKHSKSFKINKTTYTTTDPNDRELTVVNIYTPKVKMANKEAKDKFKEMCLSLKEELSNIHSDYYDILSYFEDPDNVNEGFVVGISSKTSK